VTTSTATAVGAPALSVVSVSKWYGEAEVLRDVSLSLLRGKVHALLGANGSGKSTLMKIISGVVEPTAGTIAIDDRELPGVGTPVQAAELGIRIVHQEAPLIDSLSVLEAVATFRGYGSSAVSPIHWRKLRRETRVLLERMEIDVDLKELCGQIRPSDRAGLALAIAVGDQFGEDREGEPLRVLLLDEVTAAIPERDAEHHLDRVRKVADSGIAVVMVTHRLAELRIADDVVVLRGGEIVYQEGDGPRRSATELVAEVTGPSDTALPGDGEGREAPARRPVAALWKAAESGEIEAEAAGEGAGLSLKEVSGEDLDGISLEVAPGEIVGFMGLAQGGIAELPHILAGTTRRSGGEIVVGGRSLPRRFDPQEAIAAGMTVVPADRLREGGVAILSVEENMMLPALRSYWHRRARRRALVDGIVEAFDVTPADGKILFGSLSGGNQQKVLLGKWLALRPRVLVLDDPTHGVDPAAREAVFEAMVDAASLGVSVLFFSTEPEQLVRLCGRVAVIRDGRIDTELSGPELTEEAVTKWSYT
jgi:ribose transport system ATP-binding protein